MDMHGKTVIVTGAGSGIGRATAQLFARHGATLVLAGRRLKALAVVAEACRAHQVPVHIKSVDLEDGEAAAALGHWALEQVGDIDVLINNAGFSSKVRSMRYIDPDAFAAVFRINVEAVFRLTQSLLASMVARNSGTVITVSSAAALQPGLLGGIAYGAAKSASLNMMQGMTAELRNQGVRACTIIPAEVDTPILDNRPLPPARLARESLMQAEDIAQAILLCAAMPARTLVEQIVMSPTRSRDMSAELRAAAEPPAG